MSDSPRPRPRPRPRLADAARSEGPSLAEEVETVRAEDLRLLRELQANLGQS